MEWTNPMVKRFLVSETRHAREIGLITDQIGLTITGPASTSTAHVHCLPNGQAANTMANTGDPQLFAPCREEPACASGTEESKLPGNDTHQAGHAFLHEPTSTRTVNDACDQLRPETNKPRDLYERNFGKPEASTFRLGPQMKPSWAASATSGTRAAPGYRDGPRPLQSALPSGSVNMARPQPPGGYLGQGYRQEHRGFKKCPTLNKKDREDYNIVMSWSLLVRDWARENKGPKIIITWLN